MNLQKLLSDFNSISTLPAQLRVGEIISSRYEGNLRPESWDERVSGIDVIRSEDSQLIKLKSDGGQSPPQKGWTLVISGGDAEEGYSWTLYGLPAENGQVST